MSYPESPDHTGKAPDHRDAALRAQAGQANNTPMEKPKDEMKQEDYEAEAEKINEEINNIYPDVEVNIKTLPNNPQILFLDTILVPEENRGEGIGTKIINEIINMAEEHKFEAVSLQAFPKAESDKESDNGILGSKIIGLIHFYEGFGFKLDDEVYGDPTILRSIKPDDRYIYSELSPPFRHSPLSMGMELPRKNKMQKIDMRDA